MLSRLCATGTAGLVYFNTVAIMRTNHFLLIQKYDGILYTFMFLIKADEVINSIDGSLYKLQHALAQVNGQQEPNHRLSSYIQTTKDKQVGLRAKVVVEFSFYNV